MVAVNCVALGFNLEFGKKGNIIGLSEFTYLVLEEEKYELEHTDKDVPYYQKYMSHIGTKWIYHLV